MDDEQHFHTPRLRKVYEMPPQIVDESLASVSWAAVKTPIIQSDGGGGGFQQDPRQQMYETADGAGQMVPLRRHRVPLWLGTPTPLCWCSFHLNFQFPFQLRHSSYPSQGTPSVPEGYFIFSRSPKDPGTRACLYSDFFGQQYGEGVVLTSVNPQEERLAHFSEHPRVVCSSITAGLKHVGGGEQEIGFHTTGLGWTFQ